MTIEAFEHNVHRKRITQYHFEQAVYEAIAPTMDGWLEIALTEGLIRQFFVRRTRMQEEVLLLERGHVEYDSDSGEELGVRNQGG
jgi:hypothetical protein